MLRKMIMAMPDTKGADIAGSPGDVPVLIRLSLGNFQYFNDAKPDGSDFRFVAADDKTPLKFHIERFDPQTQIALVWVRVPRLTGGASTDKIFLYYGNKNAPSAADAAGTYDASQALVYHFATPKDSPQDSTAYKSAITAIFITWDEGAGGHRLDNCAAKTDDASCHIATIVVSPSTRAGTRSGTLFNHYSLLGTAEELLGLPRLGQASSYPTMTAAFRL